MESADEKSTKDSASHDEQKDPKTEVVDATGKAATTTTDDIPKDDSKSNTDDSKATTSKWKIINWLSTRLFGKSTTSKGASSPKDDDKKSESKNQKKDTKEDDMKIPSLGSILQVIFYSIMIGQSVPGPHTKFWPFESTTTKEMDNNKKKISPRYAEMRSDMYGHERQFTSSSHHEDPMGGIMRLLLGSTTNDPSTTIIPENTGIPKQQNIVLTLLNREYESYRYSMQAAIKSKVVAATEFGQLSFQRALEKALSRLSDPNDKIRLTIIEERFLEDAGTLVDTITNLRSSLVDTNTTTSDVAQCNSTNTTGNFLIDHIWAEETDEELQCDISTSPVSVVLEKNTSNLTFPLSHNATNTTNTTDSTLAMIKTKQTLLNERIALFLKEITDSLPPGPANHITDALTGHITVNGYLVVNDLRHSPMRLHLSSRNKRLFVTYFFGDLMATTVSDLRKEVTAIIRSAEMGDEVLVILQSGGGTYVSCT
jgi:Peptidase family S49 N-terminal